MPENILNLKIFRWIRRDVVESIVSNSSSKIFKQWWVIIREWDISNWEWYIVKTWQVEIDIRWNKIAELWSWDIIWEMALLSEERRNATVKAITDVEAIVLTLNDLIEMINNDENKINKEIIRRIEENLENE